MKRIAAELRPDEMIVAGLFLLIAVIAAAWSVALWSWMPDRSQAVAFGLIAALAIVVAVSMWQDARDRARIAAARALELERIADRRRQELDAVLYGRRRRPSA